VSDIKCFPEHEGRLLGLTKNRNPSISAMDLMNLEETVLASMYTFEPTETNALVLLGNNFHTAVHRQLYKIPN